MITEEQCKKGVKVRVNTSEPYYSFGKSNYRKGEVITIDYDEFDSGGNIIIDRNWDDERDQLLYISPECVDLVGSEVSLDDLEVGTKVEVTIKVTIGKDSFTGRKTVKSGEGGFYAYADGLKPHTTNVKVLSNPKMAEPGEVGSTIVANIEKGGVKAVMTRIARWSDDQRWVSAATGRIYRYVRFVDVRLATEEEARTGIVSN